MDSNGIQPTINLRLAQAYGSRSLGIKPVQRAQPISSIAPVQRIGPAVGGLNIKAASLLVHQQIESFARTAIAPKVSRVVAGQVPGTIDFSADEPRQIGPALQMYSHPADRNGAATAINLGGLIDFDA